MCGHINIARAHDPTRSPQGALSNYKKSADEPDDHAIGRSRGGLTTKIHALTDQREAPVAVRLTAGQAGDNPRLVPLLDDYAAAGKEQGVSSRDFRLLATRRIRIRARVPNCAAEESNTQFLNAKTKSLGARPKDQQAVGRPHSTPTYTGCATPSSVASTGSSSGAASRLATTSTPSPTSAASFWLVQSSTPASGLLNWETRPRLGRGGSALVGNQPCSRGHERGGEICLPANFVVSWRLPLRCR